MESQHASPPANKQNGVCVQGEQHCQSDRMALRGSTTARCVYASLGQTAGMCQPRDEWSRGCRGLWTSCIAGLTCTTGLTCLRANSKTPTRGFPSCRRGCTAFTRKKSATEEAGGSSGVQRAELDGSVRGAAGYICLPYSAGATAVLSLPPSASLSLCLYLHNFSADTPPGSDSASSSHLRSARSRG